jgi:hypothetical protein
MKMSETALTKNGRGVLQETIKAQLLLDFEANPKLAFQEIVNLPDREYNSLNIKAVKNRLNYLRSLKTKEPPHYWTLFANANKAALSGLGTAEEETDEEPPSTPTAQSSRERQWKTPPSTTTKIPTPPRSSNSKKQNNMSGSRAKLASPASAFAYNTMFDTLEEAETSGTFSFIILIVVCLLFLFFLTRALLPSQSMTFTSLTSRIPKRMVLVFWLSRLKISKVMTSISCMTRPS